MELSDVLVFVHIVAAMVWVGGGFLAAAFAGRMKTADPAHRLEYARFMQGASLRVFMPAAVVVLGAGVWLVLDVDVYEFEQMWITIGFGIVAIGAAMGPLFFKPTIAKGITAMEAGDAAGAAAVMQRLGIGSRLLLILQFVAVWAMVAKPGL